MNRKGHAGSHPTRCFLAILLLAAAAAAGETVSPSRDSATPTVQTIHVVASSHWNLGDSSQERGGTFPYHFSAPPEVVKLDAKAHVDKVLDTCIAHDDFYWTIEALWMFQAWWDNTPDQARRDAMLQLIRDDRISLSAPTHNYRSAFLGGEESNRVCYDAEKWRRDFGLLIDTAVMNDVPGYNWSLVQPLSKSGVRYFFAGPNHFIGGALNLTPKENPFWWQGPDGSRVLTWISPGGYTEGQTRVYINPSAGRFFAGMGYAMPGVSLNLQDSERKKIAAVNDKDLMEYNIGLEMERLRKGGYPYDAILVEYSHDTLGPDSIVGTMNIGEAIVGKITANAKDADSALKLADVVRGFIAMGQLGGARNPDLKTLLSGVTVSQTANQVSLALNFPADLLDRQVAGRKSQVASPESETTPSH